ncbi:MAG: hypothetical protein JWM98_3154, partial [Thermoleophilia bacterium]|nr:hypothetical protein [Thermoleophilia bacterium]
MGFLDSVTKPFTAAAHAVGDAAGAVTHAVGDAADAVTRAVGDGAKAAKDGLDDLADTKGWAGFGLKLIPGVGQAIEAVDTVRSVSDLVSGKPGASVWDIPLLGEAKGIGEGAVDLVKGVGELGWTGIKSNPIRGLWDADGLSEQWKQNLDTADYVVHHPKEVGEAIIKPITDDVDGGRDYEAKGRIGFEVLSAIFGTKGANKLAELAGDAGKAAEVAGEAGKAGEVASEAGAAGEVAGDAGKAAEAAAAAEEAATTAGHVTETAAARTKDIERLVPGLSGDTEKFAQRLDVKHLFEGDSTGGVHHVPEPGTYGNTVVEAKGTIKPNSTWRAEVTIDGVKKESTMFPREWSRADVV